MGDSNTATGSIFCPLTEFIEDIHLNVSIYFCASVMKLGRNRNKGSPEVPSERAGKATSKSPR